VLFRNFEDAFLHFGKSAAISFQNAVRVFEQGKQHHAQLLHFAQLAIVI
jgi:hypothetical protein